MGETLARFFAEKEKQLQDIERARREEVLRAAGLVEDVRERVPANKTWYESYETETVDGETQYFIKVKKPIEVTDDEFRRIESLLAKQKKFDDAALESEQKQKAEEAAKAAQDQLTEIRFFTDASEESSGAALFLQVFAWVLWIGGIIVAIVTARTSVEVSGYFSHTETVFNWLTFFTTVITYIIAGGFAMALSGICNDLHTIASRLKKSQLKVEKKQRTLSRY